MPLRIRSEGAANIDLQNPWPYHQSLACMIEDCEVTFCVTARSGLGHLRRVTNIASAVHQLRSDVRISLLINAAPTCLSALELQMFDRIEIVRRCDMARVAAKRTNGPIVVDTAVVPDLALLPRPLGLILRETVSDRLSEFRLKGGRQWDCVIIPSPRGDWTIEPSAVQTKFVRNVGWIYRSAGPGVASNVLNISPETQTVLIATGGGGAAGRATNLASEIDEIIAELRDRLDDPVKVIQALGPRSKTTLTMIDEVQDVGSHLNQAFAEANLVFTTAGYNSILELACTDTPALMFPVARTYDDQLARAKRWERRLGCLHHTGGVAASAAWAADTLTRQLARTPSRIGESGCAASAQIIIDQLLAPPRDPYCNFFQKTLRPEHFLHAPLLAKNATDLFVAGIETPPAVSTKTGQLRFAHIEGHNARSTLARQRTRPASCDFSDIEELLQDIIAPLAKLHGYPIPPELGIQPLNPWLRVLPRLRGNRRSDQAKLTGNFALLARRQQLLWNQRSCGDRCSNSLVHGDFHCGQLIRPRDADKFLLFDLDDLAIGYAESDIANFSAHFVTCGDLFTGDRLTGFTKLVEICSQIYADCRGINLNRSAIDFFGSVSLLRRALKLGERGAKISSVVDILESAENLFEDCRSKLSRGHRYVLSFDRAN